MHHYRYKLDVEVCDGDETGIFIFWDNTLDELLGVTAAALLADQTKVITTAFLFFLSTSFVYLTNPSHDVHSIARTDRPSRLS
jgi:hypothetical protein